MSEEVRKAREALCHQYAEEDRPTATLDIYEPSDVFTETELLAALQRVSRRVSGPGVEESKHRSLTVPMIPPECIGIDVTLETDRADSMMNTVNPTLYEAPEAFYGVNVGLSH